MSAEPERRKSRVQPNTTAGKVTTDVPSTIDREKYTMMKIKLTPHALWTDPLGSAAQEVKTLVSTPSAADMPRWSAELLSASAAAAPDPPMTWQKNMYCY
jgi:hypothetical protein